MADIQQDSATHEDNIILCMKWGTKYGAEYVNRLYNMVQRHLTLPFKMVCLTDRTEGIDPNVQCFPIPPLDLPAGSPERGAGASIPPFSALIFDVELVAVK
jgi:hypothetical protein